MKKHHRSNRALCAAFASLFLLSSCTEKLSLGESLIEGNNMLDKRQFIEETRVRSNDVNEFGPQVETKPDADLRTSTRKLIKKEEPIDTSKVKDEIAESFPVSVNIENMDIRTFAEMMSRISGVNIFVSEEVNGTVTAKLANVPWTGVMDSVLDSKLLAKHVDHKSRVIRIHSQEKIAKLDEFERTRQESLQKATLLKRASEPLYTEIFKLFYTDPEKVRETLLGSLGANSKQSSSSIRNTEPEITVDKRMNMIVVKARKEDMDVIAKLISEVDTRTKQVFIEAFIVEVEDGFENALGTRLGLSGADRFDAKGDRIVGVNAAGAGAGALLSDLGVGAATSGINFLAGTGTADELRFELTALEQQGLTRVISNPKVFTLDNQEAIIFQGDEVPYETVSQDGTKIEFKEAGLRLAVKPSVVGDGNLVLNIQVNKDTVDTSIDNPPITKSEIITSLVSKDQSIVVIGGIYGESKSKAVDKVPLFGDIPGLGHLFRRDAKENTRSELMIFIAPRVI